MLRFANQGNGRTGQISCVQTMDITLPRQAAGAVRFRSLAGDSCSAASFLPVEQELQTGDVCHLEPTGGRSSQISAFPYFDLAYEDVAFMIAVGWSGQWQSKIRVLQDGVQLTAGLPDADFYLDRGESVRGPSVLFMAGKDPETLSHDFRRIQRWYFSPKAYLGDKLAMPLSMQNFDRYFNKDPTWKTEEVQLRCVDKTAKMKYFNYYWLDAAWFKNGFPTGVGNYQFASGFPRGLKKIAEKCHENNLSFITWFEPERIHQGSDLYENHRDKLLFVDGDVKTALFNLASDTARDWLADLLIDFIRDNGIDCYRQDFNMNPLAYWRQADEKDRSGITEMKYIAGLYDLWDRIQAAFPDILIDNCASGGRRIDFETCRRSVPLWRSDTGCFPASSERHTYTWHQNQTIGLTRYLAYHATSAWDFSAYVFRSSATSGLACDFDILSPDFDDKAAMPCLQEFWRLNPYWDGNFYPLTPAGNREDVWAGYQLALGGSGFCAFFRRDDSEESERFFPIHEIDPDCEYLICLTDEHYDRRCSTKQGRSLVEGILISIPEKHSSLILEYQIKHE